MSPADGPLFGNRLPFLNQIAMERQYGLTRMHEGLYHWLSHYQQMMVLQAGSANGSRWRRCRLFSGSSWLRTLRLATLNVAFQPRARVLVRLAWSGIIGDLAFYGGFLGGLWYLVRGLLGQQSVVGSVRGLRIATRGSVLCRRVTGFSEYREFPCRRLGLTVLRFGSCNRRA